MSLYRGNREFVPEEVRLPTVHDRTYRQGTHYETYIQRALRASDDADSRHRLAAQLCKVCFYIDNGGFYGAAFTNVDCRFCKTPMTFSSTKTDDLCPDCAKKHKLCKHCMADIDLKKRRKL